LPQVAWSNHCKVSSSCFCLEHWWGELVRGGIYTGGNWLLQKHRTCEATSARGPEWIDNVAKKCSQSKLPVVSIPLANPIREVGVLGYLS